MCNILFWDRVWAGQMQDAKKQLKFSCMYVHTTLITHFLFHPKSKCSPTLCFLGFVFSTPPYSYECILPTLQMLNSMTNGKGIKLLKKLKSLMTAHNYTNYTNYQQIQHKVAQNKLLSWNLKIDGFDISLGQLDGCTPLYVLGQFSTYQV